MKSITYHLFCAIFATLFSLSAYAQHRPDGLPQGHSIGNGGGPRRTVTINISPLSTPTIDLWDGAKVMDEE